jgi:hypothetical protein
MCNIHYLSSTKWEWEYASSEAKLATSPESVRKQVRTEDRDRKQALTSQDR